MTPLFSEPLEALEVGARFTTRGRTITEADVVAFSGLTGDWHPQHADAEWARDSAFGERIAHGLLCLAIQSGLFNRAATEYATLGLAGLRWKFKAPVKIGDTIRLKAKVSAKKDLDKADRGLVTIERTIVNQRDEVVQQGETDLIVEKKR